MNGLAFHCHHEVLIEYVHSYDERVRYIRECKPRKEQKLRLRLFKMIPKDRLPKSLVKAGAKWDKAGAKWDKAWTEWVKAWTEWDKAVAEWDKAIDKNKQYLEKLHKELCPDCPWDGHSIFKEEK